MSNGIANAATISRWVLVSEAAQMVGVSPQALRDRIRRKTLDSKPGHNGMLVRPCDCMNQKKAGRKAGDRTEADRKAAEHQRRDRARMYWTKKILYGFDQPQIIVGISANLLQQEKEKLLTRMKKRVEVEVVEIHKKHGNSFPAGMED